MNPIKLFYTFVMVSAVSACGGLSLESASRNAPAAMMGNHAIIAPSAKSFDVKSVRVTVPASLAASEANSYYPGGDIVWREDPPGDRHAQVQKIVQDAMTKGVSDLPSGTVPAMVDIEMHRFHALTEKARYTTGGLHSIQFTMVLRDPSTGAAFGAPKFIKANLKAFGGQTAIDAERKGLTQKVRITEHLASVIRQELTAANGYVAQNVSLAMAQN